MLLIYNEIDIRKRTARLLEQASSPNHQGRYFSNGSFAEAIAILLFQQIFTE
jgi:hypothetical protein